MRSIESLHGQDLPQVGWRIPRWNPRSTDVPVLARRWGCDAGTAGGHPGGVVPGCRRATASDADAPRPWRRRRSAAQAGGSIMAVAASLARAPGTARALSSAGTMNRWPAAAAPARRSPRIAKNAFQPGEYLIERWPLDAQLRIQSTWGSCHPIDWGIVIPESVENDPLRAMMLRNLPSSRSGLWTQANVDRPWRAAPPMAAHDNGALTRIAAISLRAAICRPAPQPI